MYAFRYRALVVLTAGISGILSSPARSQPFFQGLGDLPGSTFNSTAAAVSADGSAVVGRSASTVNEAFIWTNPANGGTGMRGLGVIPSSTPGSAATDVSADGFVVVGRSPASVSVPRPFRWTDPLRGGAGMVDIGLLPGFTWARFEACSSDGSVAVGYARNTSGFDEVIRWIDPAVGGAGLEAFGAIPGVPNARAFARAVSDDGMRIVGWGTTNVSSSGAFVWDDPATGGAGFDVLPALTGGLDWSFAQDITPDGSIIVGSSSSAAGEELCRWKKIAGAWTIEPLQFMPGFIGARPRAVSADGSAIVGVSFTGNGAIHDRAFIWTESGGFADLKTLLESAHGLNLAGWVLSYAEGLSDDGRTLTGWGTNPSLAKEGWIASLGEASCYPDCDQSTGVGILDIFDFLCFQNSFVNSEPYACDCDTSTGNGVCDVFDFLCFQNAFVGGCP